MTPTATSILARNAPNVANLLTGMAMSSGVDPFQRRWLQASVSDGLLLENTKNRLSN